MSSPALAPLQEELAGYLPETLPVAGLNYLAIIGAGLKLNIISV